MLEILLLATERSKLVIVGLLCLRASSTPSPPHPLFNLHWKPHRVAMKIIPIKLRFEYM